MRNFNLIGEFPKKVNSQLEEEIQSKKEIQEKLVLEEKNGELLKRKLEEAEKLKMDFSAKLEKEVDTHRILSEKLSLEHFKNTIPGTIDNTSDFIDQIRQLNNEKQNLVCDLKAAQAYSRKLEEDQVKSKNKVKAWWWNPMMFLIVVVLVLFFQWIM